MYLGRIVAVGCTRDGVNAVMYRVSSRSFPNREAVMQDGVISIVPRSGFASDLQKNPYIAYHCLMVAGEFAVAGNGSHTDPIAEKIAMRTPVRDAMTLGLLAMDYEKDALNTPRIVAAVHLTERVGYLGVVRSDAVMVREMPLEPGRAFYLSTYDRNEPDVRFHDASFEAAGAAAAAGYVVNGGVFAGFDNPVASAAAMAAGGRFELASLSV